ncbi:MAG: methyltransferase [Chitinophagaceae bacterium]|nr:methyltransferase [Chitinophagaceae bacterium]
MKVTEMACIFGAVTNIPNSCHRILDIGSGTGLLSLMMGQRSAATKITGIEFERAAYLQSIENVSSSPYSQNIEILLEDARVFTHPQGFDLIISNPPFFENQLPSPDFEKNKAWHHETLSLKELLNCVKRNLTKDGHLSVLFPNYRKDEIINEANSLGLYLSRRVSILHQQDKPGKVSIFEFSQNSNIDSCFEQFIIKEQGGYTPSYKNKMNAFYLKDR